MNNEEQLSAEAARQLTDEIKGNLRDLEDNLKYFHAIQGWLPLGYDSFTTWWDSELSGLPIAAGLRNWAIYAMIQENLEGDRIRSGMVGVMAHATGVAPQTIIGMKGKGRARARIRQFGKRDEDPATLSVLIPTRWHRHLIGLSVRKDTPMSDLIRPLIKEGLLKHYGIDLDKPLNQE